MQMLTGGCGWRLLKGTRERSSGWESVTLGAIGGESIIRNRISGYGSLHFKSCQTHNTNWARCTRRGMAFQGAMRERPIGLGGQQTTRPMLAEFSDQRPN